MQRPCICYACMVSRQHVPLAAMRVMLQVNELAFTRDGKLFMQATSSGVEVQHSPTHSDMAGSPTIG